MSEYYKACRKCGIEYPCTKDFFRVDKGRPDMVYSVCKKCTNERRRQLRLENPERARIASNRWNERHKDKAREWNRIWRDKHPDKVSGYNKKWRTEHADKVNKSIKMWQKEHRNEARNYTKKWIKENPEKK